MVAPASLRAGEAASCRPCPEKVKRIGTRTHWVQVKLEVYPELVEGACPELVEGLRHRPARVRALVCRRRTAAL